MAFMLRFGRQKRDPESDREERESPVPVEGPDEAAETDLAASAERFVGAVAGLRSMLGEEQLDVRARVTELEERLLVLEHLVGQLVARAELPADVGGRAGRPARGKKTRRAAGARKARPVRE